jgi:Ca2+-binding EF-hand superfamily protein
MGCNCGKEQEKVHGDVTSKEIDFTLKWFKDNHDSTKMWGELAKEVGMSYEVEEVATKDLRAPDTKKDQVEQHLISKERTKKCLNKLFQHLVMDMIEEPKEIPLLKHIGCNYQQDKSWREGGMQRISDKVELNNQTAVEVIFDTIDEDKSGFIDKKEFTNLYGICDKFFKNYQHKKSGSKDDSNDDDELMTRFGIMLEKILDGNHDGLVSEDEMSDALKNIGNNIYQVIDVWMGLFGLMAMEMMNGTIDKLSSDRVAKGESKDLEWDDKAWGATWNETGNAAELARYCVGLRAILEDEQTFKTIGELYGLKRTQMVEYRVALPQSGDEASEVCRLYNLGKKNCASFLLLMCPISMFIKSLEDLANVFNAKSKENEVAEMTRVEFNAVVTGSFNSPHTQISAFLDDLANKMHPENPASPVKVGGGDISAEGASSPAPASPENSSKADNTIHRIFDILLETDTKKVIDKFMTYFVDQKEDLLQAFYKLLQFGRAGESISKKQLRATFITLMTGGAPIEERPRMIFDAFDADSSGSVDPAELKAAVDAIRDSFLSFAKATTRSVHKFMEAQVFPSVSKVMMDYVPHGSAGEGAAGEGAAGEDNTIVMANVLMALSNISTKLDGKHGHGLVASMCKPILDFKYKKKAPEVKEFKKQLKKKVADQMKARHGGEHGAETDSTAVMQLSILAALFKEIEARC